MTTAVRRAMRMGRSGATGCRTVAADVASVESSGREGEHRRAHAVESIVMRGIVAALAALTLAAASQAEERIAVPGGTIAVEIAGPAPGLDRAALLDWVRHSAGAVATFYGHFPVAETRLVVMPVPGHGVSGGRTWAEEGGLIRIRVGVSTTPDDYANDWVLVHEMTHLALPSLPESQEWLEEGLATYVEPLARVQAGGMTAEAAWSGMVRGMPNGLPQAGDRGLDRMHTWGRTYWGGALFCLLADLEIRRRTGNRLGLQDALRAILAAGTMENESSIERLLAIGDRAVGVPVLAELYGRMKDQPAPTDLEALWQRLGIVREGRGVRFLEDAPEAALRRAMTTPPASARSASSAFPRGQSQDQAACLFRQIRKQRVHVTHRIVA